MNKEKTRNHKLSSSSKRRKDSSKHQHQHRSSSSSNHLPLPKSSTLNSEATATHLQPTSNFNSSATNSNSAPQQTAQPQATTNPTVGNFGTFQPTGWYPGFHGYSVPQSMQSLPASVQNSAAAAAQNMQNLGMNMNAMSGMGGMNFPYYPYGFNPAAAGYYMPNPNGGKVGGFGYEMHHGMSAMQNMQNPVSAVTGHQQPGSGQGTLGGPAGAMGMGMNPMLAMSNMFHNPDGNRGSTASKKDRKKKRKESTESDEEEGEPEKKHRQDLSAKLAKLNEPQTNQASTNMNSGAVAAKPLGDRMDSRSADFDEDEEEDEEHENDDISSQSTNNAAQPVVSEFAPLKPSEKTNEVVPMLTERLLQEGLNAPAPYGRAQSEGTASTQTTVPTPASKDAPVQVLSPFELRLPGHDGGSVDLNKSMIESQDGMGNDGWSHLETEVLLLVVGTIASTKNIKHLVTENEQSQHYFLDNHDLWQNAASYIPSRTPAECCQKWGSLMAQKKNIRSHYWTAEETERLEKIVKEVGQDKWAVVSSYLPGRAPLQCKERWETVFDPSRKRGAWTKEEIDRLMVERERLGNNWKLISEKLPGRTRNDVKNFWHSRMKKSQN